jgi:hypothetical protein
MRLLLALLLALLPALGSAAPLSFTIGTSEPVVVDTSGGTPLIWLNFGGGEARAATYRAGSGTAALEFAYDIVAGDFAPAGIIAAGQIKLAGGAIRDLAGNPLTLSFTPPDLSGVRVRTYRPVWTTDPITAVNASAAAFEITKAPLGASFAWEITSDGGGSASGSGTIASAPHPVTGIDLSGLGDGTLTLSLTLTTAAGTSAPRTVTVAKSVDWCTDPAALAAASPGAVCPDGSVYAGLSPDGDVPMFVTRCDLGQSWDGAACTGTRTLRPWNDGTTNFLDTPLANCTTNSPNAVAACNTGKSNSAFLNTADSSSAAGTQPHLAAQACEALNLHGKDDWYLPAQGELYVMWVNKTAIGNFGMSILYYSSSEHNYGTARLFRFSDGHQFNFADTSYQHFLRCARR